VGDFRLSGSHEVVQTGQLGYPGATDEQLANLERRLGRSLPPSSRAVLRVFGGVTTNHSGHTVTAAQMTGAVKAAPGEVSGYWLNDPAGGAYCPKCNGPYPAVAGQFLADLASEQTT
jgi:hypothetical protein